MAVSIYCYLIIEFIPYDRLLEYQRDRRKMGDGVCKSLVNIIVILLNSRVINSSGKSRSDSSSSLGWFVIVVVIRIIVVLDPI